MLFRWFQRRATLIEVIDLQDKLIARQRAAIASLEDSVRSLERSFGAVKEIAEIHKRRADLFSPARQPVYPSLDQS